MKSTSRAPDGGRRRGGIGPLLLLGLVPVAAAFAVYAGAFGHGFIWDDPLVLEQLRHFHGWRDFVAPPAAVPKFYYRPVVFLTFLLDRAAGGEAPFLFHATAVAWHAAVTGLVYVLAVALFGADRAAAACLGALLFAVHPVHVESVAWIAGRSDVIATTLLLVALLLAARVSGAAGAWLSAAVLLAACLAKEVALAGLVLVPAGAILAGRRRRALDLLPAAVAAVVYFVLRHNALGTFGGGFSTGSAGGAMLGDFAAALGWYFLKLFFPVQLNAYVPEIPHTAAYPVLGAAVAVGGAVVFVLAWKAGRRKAAFVLLWFFAALAPSLGVIVRRSASAVLAERYLYLPSVALALGVACFLASARRPGLRKALTAAVCVLVLAGAAQSVARTRVWANDVTFWADVTSKVPGAPMPHRELAAAYLRRNQLDDAERELRRSLSTGASPEEKLMTYNNLGNLYFRGGRFDEAERAFRAGLGLRSHGHLFNGLGRVAMKRAEAAQAAGNQNEVVRQVLAARKFLDRAVALDPGDYKSHSLLGQVLLSLGDRAAARRHFETALRIEPRGEIAAISRRFLQQIKR